MMISNVRFGVGNWKIGLFSDCIGKTSKRMEVLNITQTGSASKLNSRIIQLGMLSRPLNV